MPQNTQKPEKEIYLLQLEKNKSSMKCTAELCHLINYATKQTKLLFRLLRILKHEMKFNFMEAVSYSSKKLKILLVSFFP